MKQLMDQEGRKIDYLRISITDRCNLRCRYCMPIEGVEDRSHDGILRYEEMLRIVRVGVELGIKKVRITGGEPLVRRGVVEFVRQLGQIEGLTDLSMTTNGVLLPQYAEELKQAGLRRLNISLDSLQREKYALITRRDQLNETMSGIETALKLGFEPVKINVVMMRGVNDDEIMDFVKLARQYPLHVRFIEFMPLGSSKDNHANHYISLEEVKDQIEEQIDLVPAIIQSSGPAQSYKLTSGTGTVGFITSISQHFCSDCNRLRLTSDGKLRPCLGNNLEIDLREEQGEIQDLDHIRRKIQQAILMKPGCHSFFDEEEGVKERNMFQIGG